MFEIIITSVFMLLLPLTMVICGVWFIKSPPEPESGIGYRTRRSMTSADTWLAAHRICGRIWLISGIITLLITLIGCVFAVAAGMNADKGFYNFVLIEEAVQLALLLGAIPVTESRLKKLFHI